MLETGKETKKKLFYGGNVNLWSMVALLLSTNLYIDCSNLLEIVDKSSMPFCFCCATNITQWRRVAYIHILTDFVCLQRLQRMHQWSLVFGCLSVTRLQEASLCKRGWTDRGPTWGGDSIRNIVLASSLDFLHVFDAAFAKFVWALVLLRTDIFYNSHSKWLAHSCYNLRQEAFLDKLWVVEREVVWWRR